MIPWFELPGTGLMSIPDGLAIVAAVAALALLRRRARRSGLSARRAVDGLVAVGISGLLFGHTLDVLLYRWAEWRVDWRLILPWSGGYSSLGALVGLVTAAMLFFRDPGRRGLRWDYLDHVAVALMLGLAILRTGCFLGHHHAGRLSAFFLAVRFPGGARHDLGLYDALLALAIFAGVQAGERGRQVPAGLVCGWVMLAYAVGRFGLEFLRGDDIERIGRHSDPRYAGLTLVQYAAIVLALAAIYLLARLLRHQGAPHGDRGRECQERVDRQAAGKPEVEVEQHR